MGKFKRRNGLSSGRESIKKEISSEDIIYDGIIQEEIYVEVPVCNPKVTKRVTAKKAAQALEIGLAWLEQQPSCVCSTYDKVRLKVLIKMARDADAKLGSCHDPMKCDGPVIF